MNFLTSHHRRIIRLDDGDTLLICFTGDRRNLEVRYHDGAVESSWSETPDVDLPDGMMVEPGSERDFVDIVEWFNKHG
jgi:hypothetical protein